MKTESRELIVNVIKEYLPNQKITMFELLGSGVGAMYYAENLDIEHMALIERDEDLLKAFKLSSLVGKIDSAKKYNCSAQKFFKTKYPKEYSKQFFNVVNLDFCSWFYNNDKVFCTANIIKQVFDSEAISDNGLLFTTFQVGGLNLDRYKTMTQKNVPLSADEILIEIKNVIKHSGYKIKNDECIFENKYRSALHCRGQEMLNLGFRVEKNNG